MNYMVRQISSLEKIRENPCVGTKEIQKKTAFRGERFHYQLVIKDESGLGGALEFSFRSPLPEAVSVSRVEQVIMDCPAYPDCEDEDYITKEPGLMPDLLFPVPKEKFYFYVARNACVCLWVTVDISDNFAAGTYEMIADFYEISVKPNEPCGKKVQKKMELTVLDARLPKQNLIYTQWFYADCIANAHQVDIYSKEHWDLIEKYIEMAAYTGINMLLVPVITPPLDTAYQRERPIVQLVDIAQDNGEYRFNFDKVRKWIKLCKIHGISYFEISHFFSQWGAEYTPNIYAMVDGKKKRIFGWDVPAGDESYAKFLQAMIPELILVLKEEGIAENTYFHISDEPSMQHMEGYSRACRIIKPLISGFKAFDALSDFEFYQKGLVSCPVTASDHIEPFLQANVEEQWVYYCCGQGNKVSNRFLAMPSYRNRIMGLQMYRWGIKGFLQWGYNFYNAYCSLYPVNPYQTTSGDGAYPSGDAFSVYPGKNGPLLSLRALVFREGLQDILVCRLLESYIGREAVVHMIEEEAGMPIHFDQYPKNPEFILSLREKMTEKIKAFLVK